MRRFFAILSLIVVLVAVVVAASILLGVARFSSFSTNEELITGFLLTSAELLGLVVTIALILFILYQYIQYRRPYRLVFEAFSNESKLVDAAKKPLNLSILAQEELARQFKLIYRDLKEYSDKDSQDFEALVADELYIEEELSGNDVENYVAADQIKKGGMVEDLKEVIKYLKDPKGINVMHLVGEIAPKEVTPIMKFIEAIFPPHVIRATGHLQGKSDKSGRAGITFEYVDLGSQRNLMVRTLRWRPSDSDHIEDCVNAASPAQSNTINEKLPNEGPELYIELLSPAMYWVSLMFWEQKLVSNVPFMNRILKAREKRRKARIFYLIGALYYAHSNRFKPYSSFFYQLAVEHLRLALITDANWSLPYLYLANLYSFKAQEKADDLHEKLFDEAFKLYDKAREIAEMEREPFIQARIRVDIALAKLTAGVGKQDIRLVNGAVQEIEVLKTQMDPANYEPARADCAAFMYNLATWYELASDHSAPVPNVIPREEARRYLAYSLARSPSLWKAAEIDEKFKSIRDSDDLQMLKEALGKRLCEEPSLVELTLENFRTEIDKILEEVDHQLGRSNRTAESLI